MNIIFFDTDCALRNKYIYLLIKLDKKDKLFFSSLNSQTFHEVVKDSNLKNIDSIIFYSSGDHYIYSDAILNIAKILGYKIHFIYIIPKIFRDNIYKIISKYRKSFKKISSCKIPDSSILYKFLDY